MDYRIDNYFAADIKAVGVLNNLTSGAIMFCTSDTVAVVTPTGHNECQVEVASPRYEDDEEFYHFYLGHKIDCIEEYFMPLEQNTVLVYPNCNLYLAKTIVSAAFIDNESDVEDSSIDDIDAIPQIVDDMIG